MSRSPVNPGVILSALSFAAEKHRDQRRKDREASPYINHLIEVSNLLWNIGKVRDENVLAAAILHDTLEDTQTQSEEIESAFGKIVLGYVQEVTDDKSLPKAQRKQLQIDHAPKKSPGAKQIKLADKCSNLYDIMNSPPVDWSLERRHEYFLWAKAVVEGLRGENTALESHFDQLFELGMKRLNEEI
ncbi:MAG: HD domain-containing protein [Bacteroidia bacterium]|nr:HD domain-containing protein [Bacteroidia bacterium]